LSGRHVYADTITARLRRAEEQGMKPIYAPLVAMLLGQTPWSGHPIVQRAAERLLEFLGYFG